MTNNLGKKRNNNNENRKNRMKRMPLENLLSLDLHLVIGIETACITKYANGRDGATKVQHKFYKQTGFEFGPFFWGGGAVKHLHKEDLAKWYAKIDFEKLSNVPARDDR